MYDEVWGVLTLRSTAAYFYGTSCLQPPTFFSFLSYHSVSTLLWPIHYSWQIASGMSD